MTQAITRRAFLGSTAAAALLARAAWAGDWPMYRNATHDGHSDEKILKTWPEGGPKVLWKAPMGLGFSAVSVVGNRAFVNGESDGKECCVCLDADTGKEVWKAATDSSIKDRQGGDGPRSTPTVDGDFVYVLGTHLKLTCLKIADGSVAWSHDLRKEFGGEELQWGNAASPILDGDRLFVNAGGGRGQSLLAFDKKTGKDLWAKEDDKVTHSSPTVATIHDVRQVIFLTQRGLVAVKPEDGTELWRWDFSYSTSTASSPIVGGDFVYCAAAYSVGAGACKMSAVAGDGTFSAGAGVAHQGEQGP